MLQQALERNRTLRFESERVLFGHVIHLRQLQLDRILSCMWLTVGAGNITPFKVTVQNVGILPLLLAAVDQTITQRGSAAFAAVGAKTKVRQFAFEQLRDHRREEMRIKQ